MTQSGHERAAFAAMHGAARPLAARANIQKRAAG